MNKIAHYLNFMGKAQAYGLTKEAADDLYKEAGGMPAFMQAMGRGLRSQRQFASSNPLTAMMRQQYSRQLLGRRTSEVLDNLATARARIGWLPGAHSPTPASGPRPQNTWLRSIFNRLRGAFDKPVRADLGY